MRTIKHKKYNGGKHYNVYKSVCSEVLLDNQFYVHYISSREWCLFIVSYHFVLNASRAPWDSKAPQYSPKCSAKVTKICPSLTPLPA